MVKMNFADPILEKIIRRWKWTRNNTILLFTQAKNTYQLAYTSEPKAKSNHEFQSILFQFQCIVATTDTYYRKMINAKDQNYGILIVNNHIMKKKELNEQIVGEQLVEQVHLLEDLCKRYTYETLDKQIKNICAVSDHEYLHQGELLLMFREAGIEIPERFRKAWAL